ncbi:MAG: phosphoesterase [Thermoguttaceae bacterium]|jgi:predicted NUDIX family phosphoesterase
MSDYPVEQILVVPTELFRRLGYFQGFSGDIDRYLGELLSPRHIQYCPRPEMERDPGFKQLIPYLIFRHCDPAGRPWVFQYTRGTGQGEGRLHRKRSVGIGGHISTVDAGHASRGARDGAGNPYEEGMRRELEEEVSVESPYTIRCVGLINDDETEVGRVHLGVVHLVDVERPAVRPREPDIIECSFRPVEEILADMEGFETWSQICMKALFG